MSSRDLYEEIWSGRDQIELVEPEPESLFCRWSQSLHDYAAELIAPLAQQAKPAPEAIMQAMLRVQRQYFRLLLQAPTNHRKHLSRRGHICLHPVYEDAYRQLEELRDKADDRTLFAPPKRAKTPADQIRSATLGAIIGEVMPKDAGE
jgi:hypothetical protein